MSRCRYFHRNGFSFIELVLLVGLVTFLGAMLLPDVQTARSGAERAQCTNNLRVIVIASHDYHDSYKKLPPAVGIAPQNVTGPHQGTAYGPILWHLLPFLDGGQLYRSGLITDSKNSNFGQYNSVWMGPKGMPASQPVKVYRCPADATGTLGGVYREWLGTTSYSGNWLIFGIKGGARIPASIPDGTSQTIMYTERYQVCNGVPCGWGYPVLAPSAPLFAYYSEAKFQVRPDQEQCDPGLPQSIHRGGIQAAMGDASVRTVADSLSPESWWHACTPAGNDILGADWVQ
jgi:hypothetical protein